MIFLNYTETVGKTLEAGTQTTTGSMIVTLLILLIIILAFALLFGIPLEYTIVVVLPLLIAYAGEYKVFVAPLVAFVFYMAIILTKTFFIK